MRGMHNCNGRKTSGIHSFGFTIYVIVKVVGISGDIEDSKSTAHAINEPPNILRKSSIQDFISRVTIQFGHLEPKFFLFLRSSEIYILLNAKVDQDCDGKSI
jgi:hypothetical protein